MTTPTCGSTAPHDPHDHYGFAPVNGEPPAHCPGVPSIPGRMIVAEPGVYRHMKETDYHADPVPGGSLSSTAVRQVLKSPAHGREYVDHGRKDTDAFQKGRALHTLALGVGEDIEVAEFPDWKTRPAQEFKRKALEAGRIPMLREQYDRLARMAGQLHAHPYWRRLTQRGGFPEGVAVAQDPETGLWLRARLDWFPSFSRRARTRRVIVWDLKTCGDASPDGCQRTIWRYRYDVQMVHNALVMRHAGLPVDPAATPLVLVFVENDPPHVVTVAELGPDMVKRAVEDHEDALRRWADCLAQGRWPDYSDGRPVMIEHPRYANYVYEGEAE